MSERGSEEEVIELASQLLSHCNKPLAVKDKNKRKNISISLLQDSNTYDYAYSLIRKERPVLVT